MQSNNKTYVLFWTLDVKMTKYFTTWLYITKFSSKANCKMIFLFQKKYKFAKYFNLT